jgi:hypothetical protein
VVAAVLPTDRAVEVLLNADLVVVMGQVAAALTPSWQHCLTDDRVDDSDSEPEK